jgi:hypothetical protein
VKRRAAAFRRAGASFRAVSHRHLPQAVPCLGAHALGAAAYAAKAAALGAPDDDSSAEIAWQLEHMTEPVRSALGLLPLLGTDASGPLGPGLLASGILGENIRALQDAL